MTTLTVKTPTLDELREVASELGFTNMGDADLQLHLKMLEGGFQAYNLVDQMPDETAGRCATPARRAAGPCRRRRTRMAPGMSGARSAAQRTGR